MLGVAQSGMNFGSTVDLDSHWDLLDAATRFGRGFLQNPTDYGERIFNVETRRETPAGILLTHLFEGKATPYYNQSGASSRRGCSLRMMMAFFGERSIPDNSTLHAIYTLQSLDESRGELSPDDKSVHEQIVAFFGDNSSPQHAKSVNSEPERKTKVEVASPLTLNPMVRHVANEYWSPPIWQRPNSFACFALS